MDEQQPIHVMPDSGTDVIEHVSSASCQCRPKYEMQIDFEVPVFVHNKLKDNPQ